MIYPGCDWDSLNMGIFPDGRDILLKNQEIQRSKPLNQESFIAGITGKTMNII